MRGRIRLGVIGLGKTNMASTMLILKDEPGLRYEITAACNSIESVAREVSEEFGIRFWTTDHRELVERPDVDVVCVFTPDHMHAEHCIHALENNKHVVCTKPMVTTLDDAKTLVKLVKKNDRKFLVGQTMRFDRQFLNAKTLFDEGALGDIIALESHYVHDMREVYKATQWRIEIPQDLMFGGCAHSIDVIRAFGGDIDSVHAVANKGNLTPKYPLPDNFFINVRFKSGVIGRVSGLYGIVHPPVPMMQFSVYGTKGSLVSDFTDNMPGNVQIVFDNLASHKVYRASFDAEIDRSVNGHGATVIRYMRHFQDCLDNDIDPCPGVVDGAKSVAAGVAAWESVKTGREVPVFDDF